MILILGGAYQGKRSYTKRRFSLDEEDIFTCSDSYVDYSKKCLDHLEEFTYACVRDGKDPLAYIMENQSQIQDKVLICQDIFCGVVPMERDLRLWRDATGKLCQYLASEADSVYRLYCGLEQRLK